MGDSADPAQGRSTAPCAEDRSTLKYVYMYCGVYECTVG